MITEVLAGVLTGSPFAAASDAHGRPEGGVGHFVMAINPAFFLEPHGFYDGVEQLVAHIKAVPLAEGAEAVYLPGEPEWKTMQERRRQGIPVSDELARQLTELAEEVGIPTGQLRFR